MNIEKINDNRKSDIIYLLSHYNLITQDIDLNYQLFYGIKKKQKYVAIGGLEYHRPYGLIRSIAVDPEQQLRGYAKHICEALKKQALADNLVELYLLTETAEKFFAKQNYLLIDRADVPSSIKSTSQFSTLCPDDAKVMKLKLIPSTLSEDDLL